MNLARLTHAAKRLFARPAPLPSPSLCQHNGKDVLGASMTWSGRVCVVYRWPDGFEGYLGPAATDWPVCDANGWPLLPDGSQMPIHEERHR